jgi:phosphoglycolate phosphatase
VLAALDAPAAAALMVGDSRNDVLIARRLGMRCILVSFGYSSVPAGELGGDIVVDRLADLPRALAVLTDSGPMPS